MQTRPFPLILVALILAIALVNGLASAYYWYWKMRWFDMPMHFTGGVWIAGVAVWWMYYRLGERVNKLLPTIAVCIVSAFGVGLVWEVFEAIVSLMTVGDINAIPDTLSDLLFDVLGGVTVAFLMWSRDN